MIQMQLAGEMFIQGKLVHGELHWAQGDVWRKVRREEEKEEEQGPDIVRSLTQDDVCGDGLPKATRLKEPGISPKSMSASDEDLEEVPLAQAEVSSPQEASAPPSHAEPGNPR